MPSASQIPLEIADGATEQIGTSAAGFTLISTRCPGVSDDGRTEIL
jgi:hypothetical protein